MDSFSVMMLFIVIVIMATGLARILASASRDVSPKPFASRKEYLDAALEMDLDLFLERARVTPRHVTQKLSEGKSAHFKLIEEAEKVLATWKFRQPTIGKDPDLKPTVGGGGNSLSLFKSFIAKFGLTKRFSVGQWVRFTQDLGANLTGKLGRIVEVYDSSCCISDDRGKWAAYDGAFEHATPKKGEWWRWTKYELIHGRAISLEPFLWELEHTLVSKEVEAGNLEPVNFGKGALQSEPDRKPEKDRGWFRMKLTDELVYRAADHAPGFHRYIQAGMTVPLLLSPNEVEPAYPRAGEQWAKTGCRDKHAPKEYIWWDSPFELTGAPNEYERMAAECGCLVPVNYGKGLEQKSGVA